MVRNGILVAFLAAVAGCSASVEPSVPRARTGLLIVRHPGAGDPEAQKLVDAAYAYAKAKRGELASRRDDYDVKVLEHSDEYVVQFWRRPPDAGWFMCDFGTAVRLTKGGRPFVVERAGY